MTLFLISRALHVLLAAIWFGALVVNIFFFVPAVQESKAAGGQVMGALMRRGYSTFLTAISGAVVLTGLYLFHLTQGIDPIVMGSMSGRVFGVGALAGLIAAIIGPVLVGRPIKRVTAIMAKAGPMADGADKSALLQQAGALQASSILWSKITLALITVALITMSISRYVG